MKYVDTRQEDFQRYHEKEETKENSSQRLDRFFQLNYRPVSHLVQVGIMVEYEAYLQIVDHFTQQNLFHPNHTGP